jgi:hypothetical protein
LTRINAKETDISQPDNRSHEMGRAFEYPEKPVSLEGNYDEQA